MKTIMILAEALLKASGKLEINRLDIQYNDKDEMYHGYVTIDNITIYFPEYDTTLSCRRTFDSLILEFESEE